MKTRVHPGMIQYFYALPKLIPYARTALGEIGAVWAPYRSTAAWYLWRAADEHKKVKPPPPIV